MPCKKRLCTSGISVFMKDSQTSKDDSPNAFSDNCGEKVILEELFDDEYVIQCEFIPES